ncbi:MAG: hypothetical protein KDE54_01945 [Caldilineaceae bacterium]|nr:hypothetical protein [Caldilineaceae bacterium]MCB0143981.1 hypothetical protein [Caldilineaceae bacterium]
MHRFQTILMRFSMALFVFLLLAACVAPVAEAPTAADDTAATTTESTAEEIPSGDLPVVGMMKLVSHPALDAEQQGVKDALAAAGFINGETVTIREANAEGDIPTLTTIAQ